MSGNVVQGVLQCLRDGRSFGKDDFVGGDVWGRLEATDGYEGVTVTLKAFGPAGQSDFGSLKQWDRVGFEGELIQGRPFVTKKGEQVRPFEVHVKRYQLLGAGEASARREYPVAELVKA